MDDNKNITVSEAAGIAGVATSTIRRWIKDFGIGFKVAGRLKVNKIRLKEILDGKVTYETQGRAKENS
jgi:hypothetical protein